MKGSSYTNWMPQRFGLFVFLFPCSLEPFNFSLSVSFFRIATQTLYLVVYGKTHTNIKLQTNSIWISSLLHFKNAFFLSLTISPPVYKGSYTEIAKQSLSASMSERETEKISFQSLVPVSISLAAYCNLFYFYVLLCVLGRSLARAYTQHNTRKEDPLLPVQRHFSFTRFLSQQDQNIIITKFVWCILKYLLCLQAVKELYLLFVFEILFFC